MLTLSHGENSQESAVNLKIDPRNLHDSHFENASTLSTPSDLLVTAFPTFRTKTRWTETIVYSHFFVSPEYYSWVIKRAIR